MEKEEEIDLKTLRPYQLGYVYKDVERQSKIMEKCVGASKFVNFEPVYVDVNYRGTEKKIQMKSAFGQLFGTQIELLQPVEGESIYKEFLESGKEGFHHVAYQVDNLSAYIDKYREKGIDVIQSGLLITQLYAYMDTEKILGIIIEFIEIKKRGKRNRK
jgi:methylmalonyl-CoA/ethylmalonyl-CoA epimerase